MLAALCSSVMMCVGEVLRCLQRRSHMYGGFHYLPIYLNHCWMAGDSGNKAISLIHKSPENSKTLSLLLVTIALSSVAKSFKPLTTASHFIAPNLAPSCPQIHRTHCIASTFSIQCTGNSSPEAQMRLICALMRPVLLGKPLLCCIIVMTKHLLGRWWYPTISGFNCTALGHNIHNVNYKRSKKLGYEGGKA